MKILIINGPNLNLLGKREPEIYGNKTWKEVYSELQQSFPKIKIDYYQSNIEGEIVQAIQDIDKNIDGLILNLGAFTHTSVAIRDALATCSLPIVEVHLSNPNLREYFRRNSLISGYCKGVISGFGADSYKLALSYFSENN